MAVAIEPAAAPAGTDLQSARWWREQAAQFCALVDDADTRSEAYYKLAFECGHAKDLKSAAEAAMKVTAPQKGIYALTFVARQYHKQGSHRDTTKLLGSARQLAERHERRLTNFGHAHLVPSLVELGTADDAREHISSIADPTQRRLASRELIAALAKHELLDTVGTKLTESEWSEVAYVHAQEGRIKETLSAAEHISTEKGRDRAYSALLDALIVRKRWAEAEPIINQLSSAWSKAQAQEKFLRAWGHEQSADAIKARLAQASSR